MLRRLLANPILVREMEIRAGHDDGYRQFNYCGPGLYLLLLESPVVVGILMGDLSRGGFPEADVFGGAWPRALFLVTVWLQLIYFSHAAARFCAGSLAVERERGTLDALRMVPGPAARIFHGKYLAALLPLLIEAILSVPLLALYSLVGAVRLETVLVVGVFEVAVILFFGLCGMYWSIRARDVVGALSRSFATVVCCNVLPLLLAFTGLVFAGFPGGGWGRMLADLVFTVSPVYLAGGLVTPPQAGGLPLWSLHLLPSAIVLLTALAVAALLYRSTLRRLQGR